MSMTELERRCLARLVAISDTPAEDFDEHEHSVLSEIIRAVLAEAGVADLVEALQLVAGDYQTSDAHHPNHVLIPVATLGAARLALAKIGANQ